MKKILWVVMLAVMACMAFKAHTLKTAGRPDYNIVSLEFADTITGTTIVHYWHITTMATGATLLSVARSHTYWDFAFLALYTTLMILHSKALQRQHSSVIFKRLLNFNIYAAVAAGLLDVIENICLLHNFEHINEPLVYWRSYPYTVVKFALAGWVILSILISLVSVLTKKAAM